MDFRTTIKPLDKKGEISHSTPLFLIGSCFTDNVGALLKRDLFSVMTNPLGTVYNPASIAAILERIASDKRFTDDELVESHGLFHSFLAHSSLSAPTRTQTLDTLNSRLSQAKSFIKQSCVAIVTLGTAYVYKLRQGSLIVSNCHKLPAETFVRSRLTVEQAVSYLKDIVRWLRCMSPEIKVIFTVSPIRHTADGLHDNQLSKSTLLMAIDHILQNEDESICYFPAYEILMDDLRDYRFYASDMKHPSDVAVKYVYSLFSDSFFSSATMELSRQAARLTARMAHRRLTSDNDTFALFQHDTITMARNLLAQHPELDYAITQYLTDYELLNNRNM